jgi:methyltransferase
MTARLLVCAVVTTILLAMWGEALISRAHERLLRARGAREPADDVYRVMQWVYPATFVAMAFEGLARRPGSLSAWMAGLVVLVGAKCLKYWAISTLGTRWTFRVLVPPGAARIARGPYAMLRHPNYVSVVGELVGVGLLVNAPVMCAVSVLGFGALLRRRIRVEERALGW